MIKGLSDPVELTMFIACFFFLGIFINHTGNLIWWHFKDRKESKDD
tara:strand:- start:471 stop:608 length:138 start_codon:yes stop_codon:yes gene_type:complete